MDAAYYLAGLAIVTAFGQYVGGLTGIALGMVLTLGLIWLDHYRT